MNDLAIIMKIKSVFEAGGNIIQYLNELHGTEKNNIEDIMISYDLQSGSYLEEYQQNKEFRQKKHQQAEKLSRLIDGFSCPVHSIMELGVGEATTLIPLLEHIKRKDISWVGGNDISYSRIYVAKKFAAEKNMSNINFFVADIFNMPFADDSIDVVYTNHSLEPNGGSENILLEELYRIAKKYIILLEPDYERADIKSKRRMDKHGYVKGLSKVAKEKNWHIIADEPFGISLNPANPTGLLVIQKDRKTTDIFEEIPYCCPVTHIEMKKVGNAYFAPQSMLAYPIVNDIPLLRKENVVLASKMQEEL